MGYWVALTQKALAVHELGPVVMMCIHSLICSVKMPSCKKAVLELWLCEMEAESKAVAPT